MFTRSDYPPTPPGCGRRLLTTLIDERAKTNHVRPFASIPRTIDAADGYRDISYRTFANAINRLAQWIITQVGTSTRYESLVYLGPGDFRYQLLAMAAVKSGHVVSGSDRSL